MLIGVDVTTWIDGAKLTLKTAENANLAELTQPEGKVLVKQLVAALAIAVECDSIATKVLKNNHSFERKVEIQAK